MLITTASQYIMGWTDTLMLGFFADTSDVGIYRLATKLSGLATICLFAVGSIAGPKFASIRATGDHARLARVVRRAAWLVCTLSFPVIVIEMVFAPMIMRVFGPAFVSGAPALVLLCMGQAAMALWGLSGTLMNMCGAEKAFRNATLAGGGMNIVLNAALIPRYGIDGAAAATAMSVTTYQLLAAYLAMRKVGIWPGARAADLARYIKRRRHHA
jgi:O-antigen/teichoic acid export membrane protein